ncbi:MAG: hypothetical protein GF421_10755 [Candidatus Aminicenantes bacterium]|nr:hypothetical protein [Candidatus Aminicenantes bacterium]
MKRLFAIIMMVLFSFLFLRGHSNVLNVSYIKTSGHPESHISYGLISAQKMREKITRHDGFTLIDCRPPEEYKAGHIPGAVNVSIDSYGFGPGTRVEAELEEIIRNQSRDMDFVLIDSSSGEEYMPQSKLAELLSRLPQNRNEEVIFYCRRPDCTRSPLAARWAVTLGYKKVLRFKGGWQEWQEIHQSIKFEENMESKKRGQLFVIGTGPAGPLMSTVQALETMKKMDFIAASNEHAELFKDYIKNKTILFDPWKGLFDYKGKNLHRLAKEEMGKFRIERFRIREKRIDEIKRLLEKGKDVGLLDNGNPCLFGPSQMYSEQFDSQDVVIIPGMSSDAAAMAVLGKSVIPAFDARMVVQSSPMLMLGPGMQDLQILKDLSKYQPNLVLYMALGNPERLFSVLGKIFPEDMPCAVIFWAGYPEKQKVVRGTIADMGDKLMDEKEKYMGLLFIGDFLEGKPYESALR